VCTTCFDTSTQFVFLFQIILVLGLLKINVGKKRDSFDLNNLRMTHLIFFVAFYAVFHVWCFFLLGQGYIKVYSSLEYIKNCLCY